MKSLSLICSRHVHGDEEVLREVSRSLENQYFPAFRSFSIEVSDGAVTVTGRVDSYYEKQVAISSCQVIAGVASLIDRIEVSGS